MSEQKENKRGFHWTDKAWYSDAIGPENSISFGIYGDDDTVSGEMTMKWVELGGNSVPQIRSFDDSWTVLAMFSDLLTELSKYDNQNITEDNFVAILLKLGFQDLTKYESPYSDSDTELQKRLIQIEKEADQIREKLN